MVLLRAAMLVAAPPVALSRLARDESTLLAGSSTDHTGERAGFEGASIAGPTRSEDSLVGLSRISALRQHGRGVLPDEAVTGTS